MYSTILIADLFDASNHNELRVVLIDCMQVFTGLSIIFFVLIMISRTNKIWVEKRVNRFQPEAENMLLTLLFEDVDINSRHVMSVFKKTLDSHFLRKILLTELLKLHENITGEHANRLEQFYKGSGLVEDSYKQLKKNKWYIKCKAIKELTQMNTTVAYPIIFKYTHAHNPILRREAQLSAVRLKGFNGLEFVNGYKKYLSLWEQMNLISIVGKLTERVPDFSSWLNNPNESVRIFALRLITHFNQVTAAAAIAELLHESSEEFIITAIAALISLQAYPQTEKLLGLYGQHGKRVDIEILKALENLGNESHVAFLKEQLSSTDYDVKFNACQALMVITGASHTYLNELYTSDADLAAIIDHIEDKRIDV